MSIPTPLPAAPPVAPPSGPSAPAPVASDFIRQKVIEDNRAGKYAGRVMTRFPPEPNGYPHIGHAKSICLNFGLAADFGGVCNLRFDDTNPLTEDMEYVEAIKDAVRWLGFDWGDREYYASDYYEQLYAWAEKLVLQGDAYVCFLSEEQFKDCRGTVQGPGKASPTRDTSPDENLALLRRMKAGEFDEGACVLRAKIDMASPNMKMRDPPMYRIKKAHHYRRGDAWCIYPMYDYAHGLSDAIEGVTHSLCTLEFENNRELYDWYVQKVGFAQPPEQTEFARLDLTHVIVSKRYLRRLVEERRVDGWDDPRMPTLAGLRRRGVPAAAIRAFVERVGVARANSVVEYALLEHAIREELHKSAPRRLVVEQPLPVVVEGLGPARSLVAADLPAELGPSEGREVPLSEAIFIERSDYTDAPVPGWKRLSPGGVVRLRHAGLIRCVGEDRGPDGALIGLRCAKLSEEEAAAAGKGVGTIHWVDQATAVPCTLRIYELLFAAERPGTERDLLEDLHPDSKKVVQGVAEASLAAPAVGAGFQFERLGFFAADPDSRPGHPVFNRVVALKDGFVPKAAEPKAAPAKAEPKRPAAPAKAEAAPPEVLAAAAAWGVSETVARALVGEPARAAWAEAAVAAGAPRADAANLVCNELARIPLDSLAFGPAEAGAALAAVAAGALPRGLLRQALAEVERGGLGARIEALRAAAAAAPALDAQIDALLGDHPAEAARLRAGDQKLLGFFLGQLKRRAPSADPAEARRLLQAAAGA
jgi:glutaminyl-tRNA synthetase